MFLKFFNITLFCHPSWSSDWDKSHCFWKTFTLLALISRWQTWASICQCLSSCSWGVTSLSCHTATKGLGKHSLLWEASRAGTRAAESKGNYPSLSVLVQLQSCAPTPSEATCISHLLKSYLANPPWFSLQDPAMEEEEKSVLRIIWGQSFEDKLSMF